MLLEHIMTYYGDEFERYTGILNYSCAYNFNRAAHSEFYRGLCREAIQSESKRHLMRCRLRRVIPNDLKTGHIWDRGLAELDLSRYLLPGETNR